MLTDPTSPQQETQVGQREYLSPTVTSYVLPVDSIERTRLDFQHTVIRRTILESKDATHPWPFLLPTTASFTLEDGDKVLDSGTGTGAWLLDLADYLNRSGGQPLPPSVELVGIDISSRCFPTLLTTNTSSNMTNMSFQILNALSLPLSWSSTFNLIHQRYLVAALSHSEWPTAISEMGRVLKAGGWGVFVEAGEVKAGAHTERFMGLVRRYFGKVGLVLDCSERILSILHSSGSTGSSSHIWDPNSISSTTFHIHLGSHTSLARDAVQNYIEMFRSMGPALFARCGGPDSDGGVIGGEKGGEEGGFDELMDYVEKEWKACTKEGEGTIELVVICARKI